MSSNANWMVLLSFALATVGCGSSGDGVSCETVCAKIVDECQEEETMEECVENCNSTKSVLKQSAFDHTGNCVVSANCEDDYGSACLLEAAANISDTVLDDFFSRTCDKLVSCSGGVLTKEKCIHDMTEGLSDELEVMKIVKESLIDCFHQCFGDAECSDILKDAGAVIEGCISTCGFDVFG